MRQVLASEARNDFSNLLNRVAFQNEVVLIRRNDRYIAALIPVENLQEAAYEIEKAMDFDAGRRAMERGGSTPFKEVLKKIRADVASERRAKRSPRP